VCVKEVIDLKMHGVESFKVMQSVSIILKYILSLYFIYPIVDISDSSLFIVFYSSCGRLFIFPSSEFMVMVKLHSLGTYL
jgi:hypothetical protein